MRNIKKMTERFVKRAELGGWRGRFSVHGGEGELYRGRYWGRDVGGAAERALIIDENL